MRLANPQTCERDCYGFFAAASTFLRNSFTSLFAKQKPLAKLVLNAKYVLVTTSFGVGLTFRITTENRHAVADVQNAIRQWGRYTLVYTPEAADLIIMVRTAGRTSRMSRIARAREPAG